MNTLRDGATARVSYQYVGAGQVVHSHLEEPDVGMVAYDPDGTPRDYAYLDRFNRVIRSKWTGDSIHDVTLTYDRNSNILTQDNALFTRSDEKGFFDAAYTMDDLNRLVNTREGHMVSGSISTGNRAREEGWPTLSQTGNWELHTLDLNGDGDLLDPGELSRTATFNRANEILTYDNDGNSGTTIDLHITAHNARGDLTSLATGASPSQSLGKSFTYDAFGRLTRVSLGATTLANYRYNALGFRIMAQYDLDADESPDDDERRYFAYDERWRVVAAFKNSSTHPKERYVHHAAGLRGLGGSSYIDSVVLRDRDTTVPWTGSSASGDTLGERRYFAQNWRADVVALVGTDADVLEWIIYSSYGVPHSIPKGDYDLDGDVDAADTDALDLMISGAGGWNLDFNRDGNLDQDDLDAHAAYRASYSGGTGGRGVQSRSAIDNTLGYAGYHWDAVVSLNHVRHRAYLPSLGRWTRRDPAGYVDGSNLYTYVSAKPLESHDPLGLFSISCGIGCGAAAVPMALSRSDGGVCGSQVSDPIPYPGWSDDPCAAEVAAYEHAMLVYIGTFISMSACLAMPTPMREACLAGGIVLLEAARRELAAAEYRLFICRYRNPPLPPPPPKTNPSPWPYGDPQSCNWYSRIDISYPPIPDPFIMPTCGQACDQQFRNNLDICSECNLTETARCMESAMSTARQCRSRCAGWEEPIPGTRFPIAPIPGDLVVY